MDFIRSGFGVQKPDQSSCQRIIGWFNNMRVRRLVSQGEDSKNLRLTLGNLHKDFFPFRSQLHRSNLTRHDRSAIGGNHKHLTGEGVCYKFSSPFVCGAVFFIISTACVALNKTGYLSCQFFNACSYFGIFGFLWIGNVIIIHINKFS